MIRNKFTDHPFAGLDIVRKTAVGISGKHLFLSALPRLLGGRSSDYAVLTVGGVELSVSVFCVLRSRDWNFLVVLFFYLRVGSETIDAVFLRATETGKAPRRSF